MKTEIEAKFVKLDIDDVRARLEQAGATLEQPMRMMRRQTFDPVSDSAHRYVRVRDEGDKVTMTYKQLTIWDSTAPKKLKLSSVILKTPGVS